MQLLEDNPAEHYKRKNTEFPLNQVLYGVSGTGKTYLAVYYALAVVEGVSVGELQQESHEKVMQRFREYQQEGQIEWLTLHHHYTYSALIQAFQPTVGRQDGLWKKLADRAQNHFDFVMRPSYALSFQALLNLYIAKHINPETEELEIALPTKKRDYGSLRIYKILPETLQYRRNQKKEGKTYSLDLTILEQYYTQDKKDGTDYEVVAQILREYAQSQPDKSSKLKNYVLVLDEMQSVNLPTLLGEGLSLLESDRRSGATNALAITLPSGDILRFPPNLYLVGTWNTSDCALPTHSGLLRKCAWVECLTRYDLIEDIALRLFCEALNEALERELNQASLVGHTYFLQQQASNLPTLLQQHLLPLLKELLPNSKKIEQIIQIAKAKAGF
jgi:5-methylcytosine-specific restriction protein B